MHEVWARTEDPTAAFASRVGKLLSGLRGKGVENYLDGILIYTKNFEQHLTLIDAVLTRL